MASSLAAFPPSPARRPRPVRRRRGPRAWLARWWTDGPLGRDGARRRWAVVTGVLAVLVCLPAAVGALPVSAPSVGPGVLLERIRGSAPVAFSGYAVSHGGLNLPALDLVGGQVDGLLSDTSQLRVWWAATDRYRVDRVTATGEYDIRREPGLTWVWDSGPRRATSMAGSPAVQTPEPPDALPSTLGRRLLAAATPADVAAGRIHTIAARRVAGRTAAGLAWTPRDPESLVREVRVWADAASGLPLAVEVAGAGAPRAYSASFLDIRLAQPSPADLAFDPTQDRGADVESIPADAGTAIAAPYQLPATIGGLPQRSAPRPFVATYGSGVQLVVVVPVDASAAQAVREQLDSPARPPVKEPFGQASELATPLLSGLVFTSRDRGYIIAGTVTRTVLLRMAQQLVEQPPVNVQEEQIRLQREREQREDEQRRADDLRRAEAQQRAAAQQGVPPQQAPPQPAPPTIVGNSP